MPAPPHYRRANPSFQNPLSLLGGAELQPCPPPHLQTHAHSFLHPPTTRLFPGVLRFSTNDWKLLVTTSPSCANTLALCLVYSVGRSDRLRALCSVGGNCLDSAPGPGPQFPQQLPGGPGSSGEGQAPSLLIRQPPHVYDRKPSSRVVGGHKALSTRKALPSLRLLSPPSAPPRFSNLFGHLFCVPAESAAHLGALQFTWFFINI